MAALDDLAVQLTHAPAGQADLHAPPLVVADGGDGGGQPMRPRVLIVDESKLLTEGVREALERNGITVLDIATSGHAAVAALSRGLTDAVIFCMKTDNGSGRLLDAAPAAADKTVRQPASFVVFHGLTTREQQILRLLVDGASNKDIARRLSIRSNTVRTHVQNLLAKLRVHTRLEAVTLAIRNGLLDPETQVQTANG